MNFSGISCHSETEKTEVYQPKVYGDIQSYHNVSSTSLMHILSAVKYKHHTGRAQWDITRKEWKINDVKIRIRCRVDCCSL